MKKFFISVTNVRKVNLYALGQLRIKNVDSLLSIDTVYWCIPVFSLAQVFQVIHHFHINKNTINSYYCPYQMIICHAFTQVPYLALISPLLNLKMK